MNDEESSMALQEKKPLKKEILEWLLTLGIALAVAVLLRLFVFEFVRVEGSSMESTLYENEKLFVTKVEYIFSGPSRGDIVICHYPETNDYFVKRVIGLPGDTLAIKDGTLYINSVPMRESYIKDIMYRDFDEITVPEGQYFVMGDNRNNSNDSRIIGPLDRSMIQSKVHAVVFPFDRFKWINGEGPVPAEDAE